MSLEREYQSLHSVVLPPFDEPRDETFFEADTVPNSKAEECLRTPSGGNEASDATDELSDQTQDSRMTPAQVELLEALTREAIAIVERYDDVINRISEPQVLEELDRIYAEQVEALDRLHAATIEKGGRIQMDSGVVGKVATLAGRSAAALGS